jgi:hypothetical protein
MREYVIIDDVLAPKGKEVLEFTVPNPFSLVNELPAMLQTIFHGRGLNVYEDRLNWDITSDPRPFFLQMRFEKGFDRFTEGELMVKLSGKQPTDERKPGVIFVEINAFIHTKFPAETPFQKMILYPFYFLYSTFTYNKIRRSYITIYKAYIEELEKSIREKFGAITRERLV